MKTMLAEKSSDQIQDAKELAYLTNFTAPVTVYMAEHLEGRMIVDASDDDTPEEVAQRQRNVDVLTGWNSSQ